MSPCFLKVPGNEGRTHSRRLWHLILTRRSRNSIRNSTIRRIRNPSQPSAVSITMHTREERFDGHRPIRGEEAVGRGKGLCRR